MKFLVNLCLSPKILTFLKSLGHEAIRVNQVNMAKSEDREIFKYAIKNRMIILTADLDFGQILAYTTGNKPSVIIFRLEIPSLERIENYLTKVISQFSKELMNGSIIVVDEGRIRVKSLPIDNS